MRVVRKDETQNWEDLLKRPTAQGEDITSRVISIMEEVKEDGDQALLRFAEMFDQTTLEELRIKNEELRIDIDRELVDAIDVARCNIEQFHQNQKREEKPVQTMPGVKCWRKSIPIEKVGLYIPGGSAPLFTTVLMLGIPAKLAGCKEVILCTPPRKDGSIDPVILYTAQLLGIDQIFKVGGAQAIAAMTYGTESIPKVDKLFGPGNQYVTKAKELAQLEGVGIDMPAGPSEVLVIADESANPEFVAADLLSQAEHGADSQVILLSTNKIFVMEVLDAIEQQLKVLPRNEIAKKALENSKAIILDDLEECVEWSNLYAPEHLILNSKKNEALMDLIQNAGSVFIGQYSCESAGDYASGTNHTLPTNGYARTYSGVSLDSFYKQVTFQKITKKGFEKIGPVIEVMATAEQLMAHKNAVSIRLKTIRNENDQTISTSEYISA